MIKVTNLHKSFGELAVLKGIDFQADTGEVIVIIGPSGMGKSTFLRCINYIERPEKGIIEIDNVKVDAEKNLLLIKGAIPGAKGSVVTVKAAIKGSN